MSEYSYSAIYSEEDKSFIGTVKEFPSLSAQGLTEEEALAEIKEVTAVVVADLKENGEFVPEPQAA